MITKAVRKRLFIITLVLGFGLLSLGVSSVYGQDPLNDTFAPGDVFAAVESQVKWYRPDATPVRTISTGQPDHNTGMAFDAAGNLYVTNWAYTVTRFNTSGTLLGTFGSGYSSRPEGIVFDFAGNAYVGTVYGRDNDIRKFDAEGNPLAQFDVETERQGSDWIDLAADQCTMFYTSEGRRIMRYDVCTDEQLEDFATLPYRAYELRILPDGGVLVADSRNIFRLDSTGTITMAYTYTCTTYWRNLSLAPGGTSFWGGCTDRYFVGFDITTGEVLTDPIAPGPGRFRGLAVFGEPTAAASGADLAVTQTDSPDPVTVGNNLTYTVTVINNGLWPATGVTLTETLPANVTFVLIPDYCTEEDGIVTCTLGKLASSASTTVTIVVAPRTEGTITNMASVMGNECDPNTANNTTTENTTVLSPERPNPAAAPEASTLLLLGSGLASLASYAGLRLRARRQRDRK